MAEARGGSDGEIFYEFWKLAEAYQETSDQAVRQAAQDPDMVAYHELLLYGATDMANPRRAKSMSLQRPAELRAEISQRYGLTDDETCRAIGLCMLELTSGDSDGIEWYR